MTAPAIGIQAYRPVRLITWPEVNAVVPMPRTIGIICRPAMVGVSPSTICR